MAPRPSGATARALWQHQLLYERRVLPAPWRAEVGEALFSLPVGAISSRARSWASSARRASSCKSTRPERVVVEDRARYSRAEAFVVDVALDRRCLAADRARLVPAQLELAELHLERVVGEEAPRQGVALAEDELDRFGGLQACRRCRTGCRARPPPGTTARDARAAARGTSSGSRARPTSLGRPARTSSPARRSGRSIRGRPASSGRSKRRSRKSAWGSCRSRRR